MQRFLLRFALLAAALLVCKRAASDVDVASTFGRILATLTEHPLRVAAAVALALAAGPGGGGTLPGGPGGGSPDADPGSGDPSAPGGQRDGIGRGDRYDAHLVRGDEP